MVTNTGNLPIAGWTVVDDIVGTVGCPAIVLLPERPVTCFATGTVEEGQYANVGTVNATDVLGEPLTDDDPSHYLGVAPAIELVKFTNDEDANVPTGPSSPKGGGVTWTTKSPTSGRRRSADSWWSTRASARMPWSAVRRHRARPEESTFARRPAPPRSVSTSTSPSP